MLISLVKYIFPGALQLNGLMGPMKTMKTDIQPIKINICYYITSDNVFSDWLTSLVSFFDKTLYSTRKKSREVNIIFQRSSRHLKLEMVFPNYLKSST